MKRTVLIAGLTMFAVAGGAVAASAMGHGKMGGKGPMLEFSVLDLNGDGQLTQDEMKTAMAAEAAKRFVAADSNGDGALSVDEMLARADSDHSERLQRRVTKMVEKRDTNGDGLLSAEEMRPSGDKVGERQARMFAKLDQNEDGSLNAEEFAAMKERFSKKRHGNKEGGKDGQHSETPDQN